MLETLASLDEMLLRSFTDHFIKLGIVPKYRTYVGMNYVPNELSMRGELVVGDHSFAWTICAGMDDEDIVKISLTYLDCHLLEIKHNGDFGKYFRTAGC